MNLWWIVRGSYKERLLCVVGMPSMGERVRFNVSIQFTFRAGSNVR
jgi:hypothetical protein